MSKIASLVVLALSIGSVGAFADEPAKAPARTIGWAEFQQRCADPNQFPGDQTPILSAVITCTDVKKEWVSATPADVPLKTAHTVKVDLSSEKFVVGTQSADVPANAQVGSCLRFKEVERTYSFQRKASCQDILGIKGDLASYCLAALNKGKNENPKGVASRDTGNVVDTCNGVDHVERQPKGKEGKDGKDKDHNHGKDGKDGN